jgi:hypothetical protein
LGFGFGIGAPIGRSILRKSYAFPSRLPFNIAASPLVNAARSLQARMLALQSKWFSMQRKQITALSTPNPKSEIQNPK